MNNEWFEHCLGFLEQKINENPGSIEFIKAYVSLIKQKAKIEIAYLSQIAESQTNSDDNHTAINNNTGRAELLKEQIESQIVPNPQW